MKINVVRFKDAVHLGTEMDTRMGIMTGERVLGTPIELSWHDGTFLRVDFKGDKPYAQLIPWANVSTVLFEETAKKSK